MTEKEANKTSEHCIWHYIWSLIAFLGVNVIAIETRPLCPSPFFEKVQILPWTNIFVFGGKTVKFVDSTGPHLIIRSSVLFFPVLALFVFHTNIQYIYLNNIYILNFPTNLGMASMFTSFQIHRGSHQNKMYNFLW